MCSDDAKWEKQNGINFILSISYANAYVRVKAACELMTTLERHVTSIFHYQLVIGTHPRAEDMRIERVVRF